MRSGRSAAARGKGPAPATGPDGAPAPFFAAPGEIEGSRGRILLIAFDFPPAQSAGALRWQKLARFAAEAGWGLDVVTLDPSGLRAQDPACLADLPPGTRVYGQPVQRLTLDRVEQSLWNLYQRLKPRPAAKENLPPAGDVAGARGGRPQSLSRAEAARWQWTPRALVRAYYARLLHARESAWARAAQGIALRILAPGVHRAIVTCGPPHTVHCAGRRLSRRAGLPLVMDMRDPWSLVERLPEVVASPLWFRLSEGEERRAVAAASLVVCNTDPARQALQALYPDAADRCITVMNGFDEEPLPPARDDGRFLVAYAGTIYLDRDPRGVFRGAARVVTELGLTPDQFGIEFMGTVQSYDGLTVEELARQEGIASYVRVRPAGLRREAMEFLAGASVLLNLPQDSAMAVPSKVFEYMRFDAWLLALTAEGTATDLLLRGSGGDVVRPDDIDGIATVLRERYLAFAHGGRPRCPALIPRCSRAEQARLLFSALDGVLPTGVAPSTSPARRGSDARGLVSKAGVR